MSDRNVDIVYLIERVPQNDEKPRVIDCELNKETAKEKVMMYLRHEGMLGHDYRLREVEYKI